MLSFLRLFIGHRTLALSSIMLLGLAAFFSYKLLPIQQYPLINSVSLEIETFLSGASAEDVETFVTKPLESALSGVDGVDYIDARSTNGFSKIVLWLELNTAANDVLADVNTKLMSVRTDLPQKTEYPKVTIKRTDRPWATFYISFSSSQQTLSQLTDDVNTNIRPIVSALPGLQRVTLEAPSFPAVRVKFKLNTLNDFELSPSEVIKQLGENHSIASIGNFKTGLKEVFFTANFSNRSLDELRAVPISLADGTHIPLSSVADLRMGEEKPLQRGFFSDKSAFYLGVWPAPGENEIDLGNRLKKLLTEIQQSLPPHVNMVLNYDATRYMREALSEVGKTLIETICIVTFIILLFLGKFRTVSIPVITIPLSISLTLLVISAAGFSINLLTVLAIVLSIGLIVDDAIVMIEFIERKVRLGWSPRKAAVASISKLTKPIISMTMTMAVVFFPISLIDGISGALFFEFAITLAVLLISSGLTSLLFAPYLGTKLVLNSEPNSFQQVVNTLESRLTYAYLKTLDKALRKPLLSLLVVAGAMASIYPLYAVSQKELAPVEDQGGIGFIVESFPDASLEFTSRESQKSVQQTLSVEGVDYAWSLIGASNGFGGLELLDWSDRQQTAFDVYAQASVALQKNDTIIAYPFMYSPLPGAGNYDVEIVLKLPENTSNVHEIANSAVEALRSTGVFTFVDTNIKHDNPIIKLNVDWNEARLLGVNAQTLNRELSTLFSEYRMSRVAIHRRNYEVIPSVDTGTFPTLDEVLGLNVKTVNGDLVSLNEFATVELVVNQREFSRFQQKSAIHVYALKVAEETKETALMKALQVLSKQLPPGAELDYKGESRQITQSQTSIFNSIGIALLLVFIILSIQFNGYLVPLSVLLSTVPLSIFAALLFTALGFTTLNIYSQIGLLTLAGLITKNGILMVEYVESEMASMSNLKDDILNAANERFRPILMTTVATVFGHFPLTLVTGAGAEARNSIGIVLVVGMAIGALISLFVTPSIYLMLKRISISNSITSEKALA